MKYTIHFDGYASASVEVEADSLEEAQELAYDKMPPTLCHHCSGGYHGDASLELGDEFTLTSAYDEDANQVLSEPTDLGRLYAEITELKAKLARYESTDTT